MLNESDVQDAVRQIRNQCFSAKAKLGIVPPPSAEDYNRYHWWCEQQKGQ